MTTESEQSTQSDVTSAELLGAVKGFLMDSVLPAVSGRDQFNTRVAANVLGIIEREMVDFQNETSPEARARRARLRDHLPSFATFNAMWAGMMILGPAGDRRPWRVQSVDV